jgi:hypothetical protein
MTAHAEAVIEEKGYDAETAMRYRVHMARNMARQGLSDARLDEWARTGTMPAGLDRTPQASTETICSPREVADTGIALVDRMLASRQVSPDVANALRHEMAVHLVGLGADKDRITDWYNTMIEQADRLRANPDGSASAVSSSDMADIGRHIREALKEEFIGASSHTPSLSNES